jgi:MFS superfamily sulfate permease-like transporter
LEAINNDSLSVVDDTDVLCMFYSPNTWLKISIHGSSFQLSGKHFQLMLQYISIVSLLCVAFGLFCLYLVVLSPQICRYCSNAKIIIYIITLLLFACLLFCICLGKCEENVPTPNQNKPYICQYFEN